MLDVTMTYKKSTKGTHVYENTTQGTAIPSLYIKKGSLPNEPPRHIRVTAVETEDPTLGFPAD